MLKKLFRRGENEAARKKKNPKNLKKQISRRSISVPMGDDTQYQILSVDEGVDGGVSSIYDDHQGGGWCFGYRPSDMVTTFLFREFRSSFGEVFLTALVWFISFTSFFSVILFLLGRAHPTCIHVNEKDFSGNFMDAYALSWTTFTTVGYGLVFPGTSTTAGTDDIHNCWLVTITASLEAFVGILFASFWGAIFLSKVARVSSFAQVTFSDPILIRFGDGVMGAGDKGAEASDDGSLDEDNIFSEEKPKGTYAPCPVLEFRAINRLAAMKRGEIIDASMNIVASVDNTQVPSAGKAGDKKKRKGKKAKGKKGGGAGLKLLDEFEGPSEENLAKMKLKIKSILDGTHLPAHMNNEENDPSQADKKAFAKLYIESQDHPFFKRVWMAKHVLDEDSPLLCNDAKDLIRLNGGYWPLELNNAKAVRACVNFDQILVSLSGTSNADANTVYAQKIYGYSDLVVGYRFCNILFRNLDGSLGVDQNLLNDVQEQVGGGAENISSHDFRKSKIDILVL